MGIQKEHHQQLAEFTAEYDLQPIASHLSGIIKECLAGAPSGQTHLNFAEVQRE